MSTPLFSFSNSPKSIPVSTNTSWPTAPTASPTAPATATATTLAPESKYKIIAQNDGQLRLSRTLSYMPRAYKDAEPFMDKCKEGEAVLINWHARPTYYYPSWYNYLYEPCIHVTYCYLRKYDDNTFHENNVYDQEYEAINHVWKYSVSPLPSKKSMISNDRYTSSRIILRWSIVLVVILIFIALLLCF